MKLINYSSYESGIRGEIKNMGQKMLYVCGFLGACSSWFLGASCFIIALWLSSRCEINSIDTLTDGDVSVFNILDS